MQVPHRLGQNKFLSTVSPIHFYLDLERWGQAFHSLSMSISLLIHFVAVQYHCKFTREINLKTAKISIFTSWVPPAEWSLGLFNPKISALSKAPEGSWRSYCSVAINGDKQSSSQKLLEDFVRHLQPTKLREYGRDRAFPSSSSLTQEKHSAETCCQLSPHSAC